LPYQDLVLGGGNLGTSERYVTYVMGRLYLADGYGTLVMYTADEQRLTVFGLASRNRVRRNVATTYRHPNGFGATKNLWKCNGNVKQSVVLDVRIVS